MPTPELRRRVVRPAGRWAMSCACKASLMPRYKREREVRDDRELR